MNEDDNFEEDEEKYKENNYDEEIGGEIEPEDLDGFLDHADDLDAGHVKLL